MRALRGLLAAAVAALLAPAAQAQVPALQELATSDAGRGWDAVGRLEVGNRSFCTGTLIAPELVLTAAHCLFDSETGRRFDAREIEFRAGWRNGRAAAYRTGRRAVVHPAYEWSGETRLERVVNDLALVELDQPIRVPSIRPFEIQPDLALVGSVGLVSYARDRAEAPSLESLCRLLGRERGVLVLSCAVDFGSSGAPVFAMRDGVARVISVVAAKAELTNGTSVALGTELGPQIAILRAALSRSGNGFVRPDDPVSRGGTGARFVRP